MTHYASVTERPAIGETSGLVDGIAYHDERHSQEGGVETVDWTTKGLYVTRLRLLSDPGFPWWDVSYCHGRLNGRHVNVQLPFSQLPKRGMKVAIIEAAKHDKVFAKGIGVLDNISTLC